MPLCLLPVPRRARAPAKEGVGTFPEEFLEGVGSKSHIAEGEGEESFQEPGERQATPVTGAVGGPERKTPLLGFFLFKMREASPQRFIAKKLKLSKVKRTSEWTPIYSPRRFYY